MKGGKKRKCRRRGENSTDCFSEPGGEKRYLVNEEWVLIALSKLRKATVSSVMSVYPSV